MYKKVITHSGQAHRDDFIAVCVALAQHPEIETVERRDPTQDELRDEACLVLDVGGRYDASRGNFDHHQLARESAPTCCLSQFLQAEGLYEAFSLMPWLKATEVMDSKGPVALAKHLKCEVSTIFSNLSPVEGAVLDWFGQATELDNEHPLWGLLRGLGGQFVYHARELLAQQQWLRQHARAVEVGGVIALVTESDNTKGIQAFRDTKYPQAAVNIAWDDRGPGWSLYRFNDHPSIDFSKLEGLENIEFAHKGGFIAKTRRRLPLDQVLDLVKKAVV